jgi:hypothetical protein
MKHEFLSDFVFGFRPTANADFRTNASPNAIPRHVDTSEVWALMMLEIACCTFCHSAISIGSCLRPAAVNV